MQRATATIAECGDVAIPLSIRRYRNTDNGCSSESFDEALVALNGITGLRLEAKFSSRLFALVYVAMSSTQVREDCMAFSDG
jgi:hypothetical protein